MGKDEWEAVEGGFVHGIDLVNHIHKHYDDYFDIAIAGFPQHMLLPPDELAFEMKCLKEKIDAGCSFIFTQMFYDVDIFVRWVHAVRAAGITIPIVPGIAPIQTWNGFKKATSLAQTRIPQSFLDALEPHQNDDERVRAIGIRLVADMCRRILDDKSLGIKGLHFYTMNLEKGCRLLLEELNLVPRIEVIKPLPWRQVCPIFPFCWEIPAMLWLTAAAPVAHAQPAHGEHPSDLLGEPHALVPLPHRELGRVPERPFR